MRAQRHVVGAILLDDLVTPTALLAAQRRSPPELAGQWEFPGGKVEPGESHENALRREIREELGVEIELGLELVNPQAPEWPISDAMAMRTWLARATSGLPVAGGAHRELRWLTREDLWTVEWLRVDALVVDALVRASILTDGPIGVSLEA